MEKIRLDKCVTQNFGCSRKEAGRLIRQGLISVNGVVSKDAGLKVSSEDEIEGLDNSLDVVLTSKPRYFMLNKPAGYVCACDDSEHPPIMSFFEEEASGLFPVGRLDLDTEGLIFITDDGNWSHRITSPKKHCEKVYEAELADPCEDSVIELFEKGILLRGEKTTTAPAKLEILEPKLVHLRISEGRYHQVKRMFAAVGNKVIKLRRLSIGKIDLPKDLPVGDFRKLTDEEIALF